MRSPALRRSAWLLASVGLVALAPLPARAQVQLPGEPPAPEEERDPSAGTRRRPPPDTRAGNLLITPRVALLMPAGSVATETPTSGLVGVGLNVGGVIGIGISRYTVLEASGGYTFLGGQENCDGCKGQMFDVGLGLSYHMAQGIAVDPWMSFGLGYRQAMLTVRDATPGTNEGTTAVPFEQTYRGFDFARIGLGADFYPAPVIGIGPYFAVDLGTNLGLPAATEPNQEIDPSVYAYFQIGVRIAFDPFRRSLTPSSTPSSRAAAQR